MLYPDTVPELSVEAVHERFIWDDDIAVAERFVGIVGASLSGVAGESTEKDTG